MQCYTIRYSRFTFVENTISNLPKATRAKFLRGDRLSCFISICKFGSFKNPNKTITSLSEPCFRFEIFILLVQFKKVIFKSYGRSTSSWKPRRWVSICLMFTMRDIYTNSDPNSFPKFTSTRSTEFKDIFPWNISQITMKTIPVSTRIVISYTMKRGTTFWLWRKVNENWDNNMIRISQWIQSQSRANTSASKNKEAGLWESQSGIWVAKLTIWVRTRVTEKLQQSSPSLSVPPE